jgi:hypothetical protein
VGAKPAVFACLLAVPLAACGTADRERDVAAVVERFHAALEDGDGPAACRELSDEAASKLERQEREPCEEAILALELTRGGTVTFRRVESRNAYADVAEGGTDFLNEGPDGWKISAAGCLPTAPERPYECELED